MILIKKERLEYDIIMVEKDFKDFIGTYAEIEVYDEGAGIAEILDVKDGMVKLLWLQHTSCYSCQVYGAEIYFKPTIYEIGDIYKLRRAKINCRKEADLIRAESLKNDMDIFRRFYAL